MGAGGSSLNLSQEEGKEVARLMKIEYEKCLESGIGKNELQLAMTQNFESALRQIQSADGGELKRVNTKHLLRLSEFMSDSLRGFELNTRNLEVQSTNSHEETEEKEPSPRDPWTETMTMRSGEVEFLIRRPLNNDEDIQYTLAAAEAGLLFMDELDRVASSLSLNRGTLSRWLLPFDSSSIVSDQVSSVSEVISSIPESLKGKLSEKQIHYLVSGVNGVRQLVRVKIADDNDLKTAKQALLTARDFLLRLQLETQNLAKQGKKMTPFQLYHAHSI